MSSGHSSISRATHNEFLIQMNRTILDVLGSLQEVYRNEWFVTSTALSLPFHRAVAEAIINRDPDAARLAMQRLVRRAENDLYEVLHQLSEARKNSASARKSAAHGADRILKTESVRKMREAIRE